MSQEFSNGTNRHEEEERTKGTEGGNPLEEATVPNYLKDHTKTQARILTGLEFYEYKRTEGYHVVGVAGFSGQWSNEKIENDPDLKEKVEAATEMLERRLLELKEKYGSKLVISSGATMEGVPKIIYDLCEKHGITSIGVTCLKAFEYDLAKKMKFLIIEGENWGDESPVFTETLDELIVLGGGGQAGRETRTVIGSNKPVTIYSGFGGTATEVAGEFENTLGVTVIKEDGTLERRVDRVMKKLEENLKRHGIKVDKSN